MQVDISAVVRFVTIIIGLAAIIIGYFIVRRSAGALRYVIISIMAATLLILVKKAIILISGNNVTDLSITLSNWSDFASLCLYLISGILMLYIINKISREESSKVKSIISKNNQTRGNIKIKPKLANGIETYN